MVLSFEKVATGPPRPLRLIAGHRRLERAYLVNHHWKSVTAKTLVNVYLFVVAYLLFRTCDPWYCYFKYLTAWGWTLIQVYFLYTLYLDIWSRVNPESPISEVATTFAQSISEVAFAVTVVVVIMFWVVIYPQESWRNVWWEVHMHGGGLILMVLDYLYRFAGFQLRNLRFVYAFATIYTITHVTTVLLSGEPIYPGMNFRNIYSFLTFLTGLTSVAIIHKMLYLFHHWSRVRRELKTVWGISEYFLIPRKKSMDVILDHDFSSQSDEGFTDETFTSRVKQFACQEILSIKPSTQARKRLS